MFQFSNYLYNLLDNIFTPILGEELLKFILAAMRENLASRFEIRPEAVKFEYILKLKINPTDWLLADTCPQAANHWALF